MRKFAPYMSALLGVKTRGELRANLRKAVLRLARDGKTVKTT